MAGIQKDDLLFKKVFAKKSITELAEDRAFYNEPYTAPLSLESNNIWTETDKLPLVAPLEWVSEGSYTIGDIAYYITTPSNTLTFCYKNLTGVNTSTNPVLDGTNWEYFPQLKWANTIVMAEEPGAPYAFQSDSLKDTVPFSFGTSGYGYIFVNDDDDVQISFGVDNWTFDTEAGSVFFHDENKPSGIDEPTMTCFVYRGGKLDTFLSTGQVGIGTNTPGGGSSAPLHLYKAATTGSAPIALLNLELSNEGSTNTDAGEGPAINFYVSDDTPSNTGAYVGADESHLAGQIATVSADTNLDNGDGEMIFSTALNNTALVEAMRIRKDGKVALRIDGTVLSFGVNSDVSLTHVHDTALMLNTAMALRFRDSALGINSSTDGQLDIYADVALQITAPTVDIDCATVIDIDGGAILMNATLDSALVVTGSAKDLDINVAGTGASELRMVSTGTGDSPPAMKIDVTAGSMDIAPSLIDGKKLILGNSSSTIMSFIPGAGDGSTEKIYIGNLGGTSDTAILVQAALGGIRLDTAGAAGEIKITSAHTDGVAILIDCVAADTSTLDINAGLFDVDAKEVNITAITGGSGFTAAAQQSQMTLLSSGTAAKAMYIYGSGGTSTTVHIQNKTGDGIGAIELESEAGGIYLHPETFTHHTSGKKISWHSSGTDAYITGVQGSQMHLYTNTVLKLEHNQPVDGVLPGAHVVWVDSKLQVGVSHYFSDANSFTQLNPNKYEVTPTQYYPRDLAEGYRVNFQGVNGVEQGEMPVNGNQSSPEIAAVAWKNMSIDAGTITEWDQLSTYPNESPGRTGEMVGAYSLLGFTNFYQGAITRQADITGQQYSRNSFGNWEDRHVHPFNPYP